MLLQRAFLQEYDYSRDITNLYKLSKQAGPSWLMNAKPRLIYYLFFKIQEVRGQQTADPFLDVFAARLTFAPAKFILERMTNFYRISYKRESKVKNYQSHWQHKE